jgi:4'-phosphopantetheinyl transferase EntD
MTRPSTSHRRGADEHEPPTQARGVAKRRRSSGSCRWCSESASSPR